jgi:hypothetical protein
LEYWSAGVIGLEEFSPNLNRSQTQSPLFHLSNIPLLRALKLGDIYVAAIVSIYREAKKHSTIPN